MSKKWNDPDARDNYVLLITLDNIIIFFIFMYVNYKVATVFLSGKFLDYSIHNLKVLFIIRFICILICSYNALKLLFSMVEIYHEYDKPLSDFDDKIKGFDRNNNYYIISNNNNIRTYFTKLAYSRIYAEETYIKFREYAPGDSFNSEKVITYIKNNILGERNE